MMDELIKQVEKLKDTAPENFNDDVRPFVITGTVRYTIPEYMHIFRKYIPEQIIQIAVQYMYRLHNKYNIYIWDGNIHKLFLV